MVVVEVAQAKVEVALVPVVPVPVVPADLPGAGVVPARPVVGVVPANGAEVLAAVDLAAAAAVAAVAAAPVVVAQAKVVLEGQGEAAAQGEAVPGAGSLGRGQALPEDQVRAVPVLALVGPQGAREVGGRHLAVVPRLVAAAADFPVEGAAHVGPERPVAVPRPGVVAVAGIPAVVDTVAAEGDPVEWDQTVSRGIVPQHQRVLMERRSRVVRPFGNYSPRALAACGRSSWPMAPMTPRSWSRSNSWQPNAASRSAGSAKKWFWPRPEPRRHRVSLPKLKP